MSQLNYDKLMQTARQGLIATETPREVLSRACATNVPFGYFTAYGGGNDLVKLPTLTTDVTGQGMAMGFAALTLAIESAPRITFENAIQMISTLATAASGNFQVQVGFQKTGNLAWNATGATTIQNAIAALPGVGVGNVTVAGTGPNIVVTFQGALAGFAMPRIKIVANTLLTAGSVAVGVKVSELIPPTSLPMYPAGHQINILKKGMIWVQTEEYVDPTSVPFIRFALNGSLPNFGLGSVRASADTANAVACPGLRFMTQAAAGGLVLLDVNL